MIEQLKTIRHHLEPLKNNSGARKALTALSDLEAMAGGQEPVAWMYDWLPAGGPTAYDWISGNKDEVFAPENCYFNIRPLYTATPVAQQPHDQVAVTWDADRTRILAVTRQDEEGRVLSVIAEAPAQQPQAECAHRWVGSYAVPDDARCVDCGAWRKQPQAEAVPTIYVSRGQLENLKPDPEDEAGTYLPVRKTPKGKFTHPLFAAPQQAEAVPPGYVLVPVEPSEEMMQAAYNIVESEGVVTTAWLRRAIYRAMLDAAIAQQKGQS